jgi:plastocyanin
MTIKHPIFESIRILPRDSNFLDRKIGSKGEIFYDPSTNSLRVFNGTAQGGFQIARADLTNISNAAFLSKATAAGVGGGAGGDFEFTVAADDSTSRTISSGNVLQFNGGVGITTASDADGAITINSSQTGFATVVVAGQNNVVAETINDTLTIVAGTNIIITTDSATDSITIAASAGASTNSFATISVAGQSNVVADSSTDTLTIAAGSGISITTDVSTDTVTIINSAAASGFSGLPDSTSAGLSIDKIYLPAITRLDVTNNSVSAYRFDQYGASDNPTIYAINGTTIAFNIQAAGHPFLIQDPTGNNYNTGLVHVTTAGVVTTGSNAQGKTSGTLYWKIPSSISGNYRYQCSAHGAMVGQIVVKNFVSV